MRVALSLALAFACHPAFAQERIQVLDFRSWNYTQVPPPSIDVGGQSKTLDILGFYTGRDGLSSVRYAETFFKQNGYVAKNNYRPLECRGKTMVGISTSFISEIVATKTNNDADETVEIKFASPLHNSQIVSIKRVIEYRTQAENAPSGDAIKQTLINKYGHIVKVDPGSGGPMGFMQWKAYGSVLAASFSYFQARPGIIQKMVMLQDAMDGPDYVSSRLAQEDQQTICRDTAPLDNQRIQKMNAQGSSNLPKF